MAIRCFLAMTAAEMQNNSVFPQHTAWMACHFSPYGTGLSNLPRTLPPQSLLLVDDITPMNGHDPVLICEQLTQCVEALDCAGVLLDFQRPGNPEASVLVEHLASALPCPFAVSDLYAEDGSFAVFLPSGAPSVPLREQIAPWEGREVWLDLSGTGEVLRLSEAGCTAAPLPLGDAAADGFPDAALHCHYRVRMGEDSVEFTLWRTREDLEALLEEADSLGIRTAAGLHQELWPHFL